MNRWAEKQVDLFETRGIQPWQTSCWIHTHPAGVERPSSTDEETMRGSLCPSGGSHCFARLDFNHDSGAVGPEARADAWATALGPEARADAWATANQGAYRQRFSVECDTEILWTEAGAEATRPT